MSLSSEILVRGVLSNQKRLIEIFSKRLGYQTQSQFILNAVEEKIEFLMTQDTSANFEKRLEELNSNSELLLAKVNIVLAQQKLIFQRQQFLGDTYEEWLERIEKLDEEGDY